jgi:CRISPR/Cas system CSM-associated protein Csm3 (group 7 of RAMP superfamily)
MADVINPYNFVPLGKGPDRSQGYPGRHLFRREAYTGVLECTLTALSPLISADHRTSTFYNLLNIDGKKLRVRSGNRAGEEWKPIEVFRFLRNGNEQPMIQGTSLKGMIRSVYEAMVDACLPMAATTGAGYKYDDLKAHRSSACLNVTSLCPACRLFGVTRGDAVPCQGRIRISDAVLTQGALLQQRYYLRELSAPKPRHSATYGQRSGGSIAGRKFYYHQGKDSTFTVQEHESNDRSKAIDELAPPGAQFSFRIFLENVEADELSRLLWAIELAEGLGHKIGLGKAIGLGSCEILIDQEKSSLTRAEDRYAQWQKAPSTNALVWPTLKKPGYMAPPDLLEVLRLNKATDGFIGYPARGVYPSQRIDARGVFGGTAAVGGKPGGVIPLMTIPVSQKAEHAPVRQLQGGQSVQCILLDEKTKKGGWKAKLKEGQGVGALLPGNEPPSLSPGQEVELIVQSTDPRNMSFRWPLKKS